MRPYHIRFHGRPVNAIGIFYWIEIVADIDPGPSPGTDKGHEVTKHNAAMAAYKAGYEHISGLTCWPVGNE